MKNFVSLSLLAASVIQASATTIITANSPGANNQPATNAAIPNTFGDNINFASPGNGAFTTQAGIAGIVGTPNIDLTWTRSGTTSNNSRWESHAWGGAGVANTGGGVLQLDGSAVGSTYSITFSPTVNTAVVINSFNFIGDTNGDSYQYRVDLVNLATSSVVYTSQTALWTTAVAQPLTGAPTINLNYTGALGTEYRLDLVRVGGVSGGSDIDIAIDNLSFDQIPEPTSIALLSAATAAFLIRRRRA